MSGGGGSASKQLASHCKSQDSLHLPTTVTTLSKRLNHLIHCSRMFKGNGVAGSLPPHISKRFQEQATSFLRAQSQSSRSFESMLFKAICICQSWMCSGDQCICQSWMCSTYVDIYVDVYVYLFSLCRHQDMLILSLLSAISHLQQGSILCHTFRQVLHPGSQCKRKVNATCRTNTQEQKYQKYQKSWFRKSMISIHQERTADDGGKQS